MTDRSMVALLLDEEPGGGELFDGDRPLQLARDDAETGEIRAAEHRGIASPAIPVASRAPTFGESVSPSPARGAGVGTSARPPMAGASSASAAGGVAAVAARPLLGASVIGAAAASPIARAPVAVGGNRPRVGIPASALSPQVTPRHAMQPPASPVPVLPGVGAVHPSHVGAVVGLVSGIVSHASQARPGDRTVHEIAGRAQRDPSRYAVDLLLATHEPQRYAELARGGRLPSQILSEYERRGSLTEYLRGIHERYGDDLRRFRDRPIGERIILGLAYASGTVEETLRALEAMRAHPHYPARASWRGLTVGFEPYHVARVASAIVPGVRNPEQAVQVYRGVWEERERALRERRRELLRLCREKWATGGPELVAIWETLTRGMSPEQAAALRVAFERDGDVDGVWTEIELRNLAHRMEAIVAAFRRWLAEWEHAHEPGAQTPLQEVVAMAPPAPPPSARVIVAARPPRVAPVLMETPPPPPSPPSDPAPVVVEVDSAPQDDQPIVFAEQEEHEGREENEDDDAGAWRQPVRAPAPAAHAADGHLPWAHLTQGFGHREHEELRRAWDEGRSWDGYREILARRGAETVAAREAEFCRRLQRLGCPLSGACRIERDQLAAFADLGAWFTPEQWARLSTALRDGAADPLEVWRAIERENLAEATSIREPGFLRFVGASDPGSAWNPAAWAMWAPEVGRVVLDGETSGLLDDLGGALGGVIGAATGGDGGGGGDLLSGLGQGLGSIFGGGAPGAPGGGGGDVLSGIGGALGSLFGGGGGGGGVPGGGAGQLLGHLGEFAQGALGALTGRRRPPPPPLPEAPPPHPAAPPHHAPPPHVVPDLDAVLRHWTPALIPGRVPQGDDPSRWWDELTRGQGLGEAAQRALRAAIDANGPTAIPQTLAFYRQLLALPNKELRAARVTYFAELLKAAQRVAGPRFEPSSLPGGDPFVRLAQQAFDWPRVYDAILTGSNPIGAFRRAEAKREYQAVHAASAKMQQMLEALYRARAAVGMLPLAGEGSGDTGAIEFVRRNRRWPRPLFHLSFGRPMHRGELARLLEIVPQLRCHPPGVLAEMAGLAGQARDVRGVDALTGEYLVREGENLAAIAHKLVGDRRRWVELDAANPHRREGNPRLRIPPSWFGFVPYSVAMRPTDTGETGWWSQADYDAYEAFQHNPYFRRILLEGGTVNGTSLRGLRSRHFLDTGDAGEPEQSEIEDEAGYDYGELEGDAGYELGDEAGAVARRRRARRVNRRRRRSSNRAGNNFPGDNFMGGVGDGGGADGGGDDGGGTTINIDNQGDDGDDDSSGPLDWLKRLNPFATPPSDPAAPAAPPPDAPIPEDDPSVEALQMPSAEQVQRDRPRQSLTQRTYTVQKGDWPAKIATRFGAAARPHWLTEFEHANPHKRVDSGTGNWFALNPGEIVNIPDAWPATSADAGSIDDEDAGALRQNLTRRTYAVVAGDGMQRIAQRLGAVDRPHWFAELRDANPHKAMVTKGGKQIGWKSLYPGEIINVPDAWPDSLEVRPAPGGVPTPAPYMGLPSFPTLPGAVPSPTAPPGTVPAAASVDPGTVLHCQSLLVAWGRLYPNEIQPRDFGAGSIISPDVLGVPTPRMQQALASFQRWSNKKGGTRLRTDGQIDPDTIAALDSFSAQALGGLPERPPVAPILGGAPPGSQDPFASVIGVAKAASDDLARRVGSGSAAPGPAAPPDMPGASTDPWAGLFTSAAKAAGELARRGQASPPPMPPPLVEDALHELPGVVQRYGAPGLPGTPGGAPHAPKPLPPRGAPLPEEEPLPFPPPRAPRSRMPEPRPVLPPRPASPPESPPEEPQAGKKKSDAIIPAVLTGLGIISGILGGP